MSKYIIILYMYTEIVTLQNIHEYVNKIIYMQSFTIQYNIIT